MYMCTNENLNIFLSIIIIIYLRTMCRNDYML